MVEDVLQVDEMRQPLGRRDRPMTLSQVMADVDREGAKKLSYLLPLATGFQPLDDMLNGGMRPGELMILGGTFGVGKTIFGLQAARNVARASAQQGAVYVCYEHDPSHLMSRLLCLESVESGAPHDALTLYKLAQLANGRSNSDGLISQLRRVPRHAQVLDAMEAYANRLLLVGASGVHGNLARIREWVEEATAQGTRRVLLVIDYLQKIPPGRTDLGSEVEITTHVAQGLKELAVTMGIPIIAIAAADLQGLRSKRMRLTDLRGGSALQYEADMGIVLHNKHDIISRDHLLYGAGQAEETREWMVISIEKNRAGIKEVDMECRLDAAHFRLDTHGRIVRERLVDERAVLA
jgi:replicative DNA helicase